MQMFVRPITLCAMMAFPTWAHAQQSAEQQTAQSSLELATELAHCAGFWDWYAQAEAAIGEPATGQNAHNISNGARLTAGYFLSMRQRLVSPQDPPRSYGSWDAFIEPLAEVTATEMQSAIEQNDQEHIRQQTITCAALGRTSQSVIDDIRRQTVDRPPSAPPRE